MIFSCCLLKLGFIMKAQTDSHDCYLTRFLLVLYNGGFSSHKLIIQDCIIRYCKMCYRVAPECMQINPQ